MQIQKIKLAQLAPNTGQIPGLPSNPRQWTKSDVERIAASLAETPELFEARPIIATPYNGQLVILGGNLRYEGARKNKDKEVPVVVIPEDTPVEKMREIVIKDNGAFGQWDFDQLANEWSDLDLIGWGVPAWETDELPPIDGELKPTEALSSLEYDPLYYEPEEKPSLKLTDCIDDEKFRAKIAALNEYNLTDEQKENLKLFAYRFLRIDFEAVANYYFFNASEEEKKAIERLRLVLVDDGSIGGFVEDDLLRISEVADDLA